MKKYVTYTVQTETDCHETDNYRSALSHFNRNKSATMYGETEDGDVEVIRSK